MSTQRSQNHRNQPVYHFDGTEDFKKVVGKNVKYHLDNCLKDMGQKAKDTINDLVNLLPWKKKEEAEKKEKGIKEFPIRFRKLMKTLNTSILFLLCTSCEKFMNVLLIRAFQRYELNSKSQYYNSRPGRGEKFMISKTDGSR
ncbi:hypothetical protein SNK03_007952 [Fusarium graminearum]|nr:unnamed protein product [Fusarium graminearum]